jgi:hypothetical protein
LGFDTHDPLRQETFVYAATPFPQQRVRSISTSGRQSVALTPAQYPKKVRLTSVVAARESRRLDQEDS